jgi:hypothetical protein
MPLGCPFSLTGITIHYVTTLKVQVNRTVYAVNGPAANSLLSFERHGARF